MSHFFKSIISFLGLSALLLMPVHAVGMLTPQPHFGASAIVHNGQGYGRYGILTTEYDAGIVFKSQSNEITGGTTNTNLFEYGIMGSYKTVFTETQVLTFGAIWTLFSGKDQGKDITGGTYFAPFIGIQQAMAENLIFDAAYYPFTFSTLTFSGGEIRKSSISAISVGITWVLPKSS